MALSGSTSIQFILHKLHIDIYAGRKSVDDTAHRHSMTFAKGGEGKEMTKSIPHCLSVVKVLA